jgi:hypothetical protein
VVRHAGARYRSTISTPSRSFGADDYGWGTCSFCVSGTMSGRATHSRWTIDLIGFDNDIRTDLDIAVRGYVLSPMFASGFDGFS